MHAQKSVDFEARVFASASRAGERLPYRVAAPADRAGTKKRPLLVFLHGAGERGDDNQSQLFWGRPWMEQAVMLHNAVVLVPQCPEACRWVEVDWAAPTHAMPRTMSKPMRLLFKLLPAIEKEFGVDPKRRYVAGISMGGYGTWDALGRRPRKFAAGVPICGGADEKQAPAIAGIPVWVFHGAVDTAVPTIRSRNMVAALKRAGGAPRYSEYPGVGHDSWKNAFEEPDLLPWLFAQKRGVVTG